MVVVVVVVVVVIRGENPQRRTGKKVVFEKSKKVSDNWKLTL